MKNMTRKLLALLGAFALVALSATALLAAPGDLTPNNIPATARYIDGSQQNVGANTSVWYKFDYSATRDEDGHRDPTTITMLNATGTGLGFKVFTPDQINDWWEQTPIGQGTPQVILSSDGQPADHGDALSSNLTWVGKFAANGTYYVQVTNDNAYAMNFMLNIQ